MSDQPGITAGDLEWIRRDQFVYYLELAHALGDPTDWPAFRDDLLRALTAAFSLDVDDAAAGTCAADNLARACTVLDRAAARHDPACQWRRFLDEVWDRRGLIRADLTPVGPRVR